MIIIIGYIFVSVWFGMGFGHILQWNIDNMFTSIGQYNFPGAFLDGHSQTAHLISILNKVPL